jgi:hypothetical protein
VRYGVDGGVGLGGWLVNGLDAKLPRFALRRLALLRQADGYLDVVHAGRERFGGHELKAALFAVIAAL